jgi:hypothetical protein
MPPSPPPVPRPSAPSPWLPLMGAQRAAASAGLLQELALVKRCLVQLVTMVMPAAAPLVSGMLGPQKQGDLHDPHLPPLVG